MGTTTTTTSTHKQAPNTMMLHKAFFLVHCGSLVSVQGMQALFKGGGNPFSGGMGGLRATKVAIKVKERDETYFFGQRLKTAWGKCYGSPADIEIIRTSIYIGGACQENVIRFGESSLVRKIPDHIQRLGKGEWRVIGVMGPRHGPPRQKPALSTTATAMKILPKDITGPVTGCWFMRRKTTGAQLECSLLISIPS